jgi:hypothetical protein
MTAQAPPDGIFISCVSGEFEKAGAPFCGLRAQLRAYLARTRSNVRVQEDFPQATVDTLQKLADEIRPRARTFRDAAELAQGARLIPGLGYGRRCEDLAVTAAALGSC